ncbi:MAG: hypothetical protein JNK67_11265 [Alphaproteobacteria bacterium]|nr:hypothetical protein [Alphaproteobacteria bacterium]
MQRNGQPSIFAWIREALAALCPLHIARMIGAWTDEPQRIPIRTDDRRPR